MTHCPYRDITERINESPKWYDENAVPRYWDFAPGEQANIYAHQVALVLISCQSCGRHFEVCFSHSMLDHIRGESSLWSQIADGSLHYGDPPNVGCCASGGTMNCVDVRVLQAWEVDGREWQWKRRPESEINLEACE